MRLQLLVLVLAHAAAEAERLLHLHPRLDRFAIRAQPTLTSISHIPDLRSLNTSTNHASSLAPDSKQSLRTQLNAELPPLKTPDLKYLFFFSKCHVETAAETSGFRTPHVVHHRSSLCP
ncbi:uncharacterized protein K444DRAFT_614767 [Hyaloscypha bicolor E]|uniref:Secreted protein n=1 Tax=Hyaloscypha bicolor E TaxID=1095630 RepID=A0A2J6T491_9HELO|nr:uncharacterized protein K444DRAFT_614767 [Hyaloscypha bicolor E]PMD57829.1 hypothetical protein K444DRAFT_614767 [Hyaloscypha bicolor E]